ncbi:hypothetical protein BOTBODRAFT_193000, partial [Botryobasidium botryosum FD-172 SS1]
LYPYSPQKYSRILVFANTSSYPHGHHEAKVASGLPRSAIICLHSHLPATHPRGSHLRSLYLLVLTAPAYSSFPCLKPTNTRTSRPHRRHSRVSRPLLSQPLLSRPPPSFSRSYPRGHRSCHNRRPFSWASVSQSLLSRLPSCGPRSRSILAVFVCHALPVHTSHLPPHLYPSFRTCTLPSPPTLALTALRPILVRPFALAVPTSPSLTLAGPRVLVSQSRELSLSLVLAVLAPALALAGSRGPPSSYIVIVFTPTLEAAVLAAPTLNAPILAAHALLASGLAPPVSHGARLAANALTALSRSSVSWLTPSLSSQPPFSQAPSSRSPVGTPALPPFSRFLPRDPHSHGSPSYPPPLQPRFRGSCPVTPALTAFLAAHALATTDYCSRRHHPFSRPL